MVRKPDPSEDERPIVTCRTVSEVAAAGMNPVAGCGRRQCDGCGEAVWISPATLVIQQSEQARIMCLLCAMSLVAKVGAGVGVIGPSKEQMDEIYAAAGGWAAALDQATLRPGSRFFWREIEWELVNYFPLPCCGTKIALVRRVGSGLETWTGLGCPKCRTGKTYTVEHRIEP